MSADFELWLTDQVQALRQDVGGLKADMKTLVGNGHPGRVTMLEQRLEEHVEEDMQIHREVSKQRRAVLGSIIVALLVALFTFFNNWWDNRDEVNLHSKPTPLIQSTPGR